MPVASLPAPHPVAAAPAVRRIGPNALIQTLRALAERHGAETAGRLARRAALPHPVPDAMVDERLFVRLVAESRAALGAEAAAAVLDRAGRLTADYVRENRVPAPLRWLLPRLPAALSLRILLAAVRRHAWTFAGSGAFAWRAGRAPRLTLEGCITCPPGGGRGGHYYAAAFERLLTTLVDPRLCVTETACAGEGAPRCTFALSRPPAPPRRPSVPT